MALPLAYAGLALLATLLLYRMGKAAILGAFAHSGGAERKVWLLFGGLLAWHTYVFLIARTGITQDYSLPPKLPLLLILPAFLFTGVFLYRNRAARWVRQVPGHWLILYQSIRLGIETLFLFSIGAGIIHSNLTLEGYNYDMVFAATAPMLGYAWYRYPRRAIRRLAGWWNFLGLAVIACIIFVAMTTVYFPGFYGSETALMPEAFGRYPYVLVAAFLMPSAVFVHIWSLLQLQAKDLP